MSKNVIINMAADDMALWGARGGQIDREISKLVGELDYLVFKHEQVEIARSIRRLDPELISDVSDLLKRLIKDIETRKRQVARLERERRFVRLRMLAIKNGIDNLEND